MNNTPLVLFGFTCWPRNMKSSKASSLVSFNYQKSPPFIVYMTVFPKLNSHHLSRLLPSIGNILLTVSAHKSELCGNAVHLAFLPFIGNLISDTATGNHIRHSLFYDVECSSPAARQSCNVMLSSRDTKMSTWERHRLFSSELHLPGREICHFCFVWARNY